MKALVDTNVLLWWLDDHPRLSPFRAVIENPRNQLLFSSISVAEISIKSSIGKLVIPNSYTQILQDSGFDELPFNAVHGLALANLPWHHRDPFDRMIISQAQVEKLPVLSSDHVFELYDLQVIGSDLL